MTVFQKTVEAVKAEYPKFSPACLSISMRSYETGVQLTPRAQQIADGVQGHERLHKRFSDRRVKCVSFRCRMTPKAAEIVKHEIAARGYTSVQEWLEEIILEWVKSEPSPVCKTGNGSEVGADAEASPSSENITEK